jgi:hypothetical protein
VSYRLCKNDYETEEEARAQQRAVEPLGEKNYRHYHAAVREFTHSGLICPVVFSKVFHGPLIHVACIFLTVLEICFFASFRHVKTS